MPQGCAQAKRDAGKRTDITPPPRARAARNMLPFRKQPRMCGHTRTEPHTWHAQPQVTCIRTSWWVQMTRSIWDLSSHAWDVMFSRYPLPPQAAGGGGGGGARVKGLPTHYLPGTTGGGGGGWGWGG